MRAPSITPMLAAVAALALGCNSQETTQPSTAGAEPAEAVAPALSPSAASASRKGLPEFDPDQFSCRGWTTHSFRSRWGVASSITALKTAKRERIITDVTREHKTILGVPVVVVLDRVFVNGELAEKTFDWYAQDKHGNVWYFGEDTKEFEDGKVVSTAGSFEAGKNGARAGIIMRAHPKVGQVTPQESAPGVAEDMARVVDKNVTVTVPAGTFRHCIKTEEFTPLEPDLLENKFYCRGVGIARERDLRGGTGRTALTRIVQR